ncbi:MAG: hypothetical protein Q4G14_13645 [Paracoccus sp. (in: a-proteobacteria)]|nr:hypothetical protein [Paracoccus sp. (in: a-proteobacteria)]MDO5614269.1 hypothetical protein [Paracoccus sp. (in: a-proteobacteria)]
MLQTLSVAYLSSRLPDIIIFGLLFAVLLRPNKSNDRNLVMR